MLSHFEKRTVDRRYAILSSIADKTVVPDLRVTGSVPTREKRESVATDQSVFRSLKSAVGTIAVPQGTHQRVRAVEEQKQKGEPFTRVNKILSIRRGVTTSLK